MTHQSILAPAAVLALWTLIMLLWMMVTRLPAMSKLGIYLNKVGPGGRGIDMEQVLPNNTKWKAHNYTHLVEQPTVFYAVVLILALVGDGTGVNTILAWGYVGLRILHSLWQATINTIPVRFTLFLLSTLCLIALSVHAVVAAI
jgi:hypothetical protein